FKPDKNAVLKYSFTGCLPCSIKYILSSLATTSLAILIHLIKCRLISIDDVAPPSVSINALVFNEIISFSDSSTNDRVFHKQSGMSFIGNVSINK
ncbi:unnamed protein product, partial [Rotaria sordida]